MPESPSLSLSVMHLLSTWVYGKIQLGRVYPAKLQRNAMVHFVNKRALALHLLSPPCPRLCPSN